MLENALRRVAPRSGKVDESAVYALTRITRFVVWIVGSILGLTFIGFDLASLALVGGALGAGVGFGLRSIFNDLLSGVIILLEKTLKVGDFVDLPSGVVGRVTDWTFGEEFRGIHAPFGVACGSDKEAVREAGFAAARQVPATVIDARREPDVWLANFGHSSLDFELVVWVGHDAVTAPGRTHARYLWAIGDELRRRGLEIPFPQRDLHLRSGTPHIARDGATASPAQPAA